MYARILFGVTRSLAVGAAVLATVGCEAESGEPAANRPSAAQTGDFVTPEEGGAPRPAMLLVDAEHRPSVTLAWQTKNGWAERTGEFGFTSPSDREEIGANLTAYVALGGTRLDKGAGDPSGLIVRTGFYRIDADEPLLPGIVPGGQVKLTLAGVRFNQPVGVRAESVLAHLKYGAAALEACGAPRELADVYLTANASDTLGDRLRDERGLRAGYLAPVESGRVDRPAEVGRALAPEQLSGSCAVRLDDSGGVTVEVLFPYSALRHVLGLYQEPVPGGFDEPDHFHVEFEAAPGG